MDLRACRLLLVLLLFLGPNRSRAQETETSGGALQVFMLTSTYGVLAGTLTGLASLAFYENASSRGRNVAMGASLGLYVGILLGAYIVYVPHFSKPSQEAQPLPPALDRDDPMNLGRVSPPRSLPLLSWDSGRESLQMGWVYTF